MYMCATQRKIFLLSATMTLLTIIGCTDTSDRAGETTSDYSYHVLHEHSFKDNELFQAKVNHLVVVDLEPADIDEENRHEKDSGGKGSDKLSISFDKDGNHEFCNKASLRMSIEDQEGKVLLLVKEGECKTIDLPAGTYLKRLTDTSGKHHTVFVSYKPVAATSVAKFLKIMTTSSPDSSKPNLGSSTVNTQVTASYNCPGCDLSGANLVGAHLENSDLSKAILRNADLTNAILDRAKLDGADFRPVRINLPELTTSKPKAPFDRSNPNTCNDYYGCDEQQDQTLPSVLSFTIPLSFKTELYRSSLKNVSAIGTKFEMTSFHCPDFEGSDLSKADFGSDPHFDSDGTCLTSFKNATIEAIVLGLTWSFLDLRGSTIKNLPAALTGLDAHESNLAGINLSGIQLSSINKPANLNNTDISGADFTDTILDYAVLDDLVFTGATLTGASFIGVDLSGFDFSGFDLSGATFDNAVLHNYNPATKTNIDQTVFNATNLSASSFRNVDLSQHILSGLTIAEADFGYANLSSADFKNSDLSASSLIYANCNDADFSGADLGNADFDHATMIRTTLPKSSMNGTGFTNIDFSGHNFTNYDLTEAIFDKSSMQLLSFNDVTADRASFQSTHLEGANFTHASLKSAIFNNAFLNITYNPPGSSIVQYYGSDFTLAYMPDAKFAGANMSGATFANVQWYGPAVDAAGATMTATNFSGADLFEVDFSEGKLDQAIFDNAILINADLSHASLDGAHFSKARLQGADLSFASCSGAQFADAAFAQTAGLISVIYLADNNQLKNKDIPFNPTAVTGIITNNRTTCPDGLAGPCPVPVTNKAWKATTPPTPPTCVVDCPRPERGRR